MGERLLLVIYLGALLVDLVELVLVGRLNVSIFFGGWLRSRHIRNTESLIEEAVFTMWLVNLMTAVCSGVFVPILI